MSHVLNQRKRNFILQSVSMQFFPENLLDAISPLLNA